VRHSKADQAITLRRATRPVAGGEKGEENEKSKRSFPTKWEGMDLGSGMGRKRRKKSGCRGFQGGPGGQGGEIPGLNTSGGKVKISIVAHGWKACTWGESRAEGINSAEEKGEKKKKNSLRWGRGVFPDPPRPTRQKRGGKGRSAIRYKTRANCFGGITFKGVEDMISPRREEGTGGRVPTQIRGPEGRGQDPCSRKKLAEPKSSR